ncbi:hypothetical protein BMS3Bbin10_02318 [bacterium BMS3Bbin10]|nr:hypothetical protein BMS3Bbin10_02318 [bacterium BMS3Bbin10]
MIGLSAALSACTTLSREECSSGDWRKIGVQDGSDGRPAERFNRHVKACGREGTAPDRELYLAGRQKGLATYCTSVRGYREGALGQKYYGVCPPQSEGQFQTGFKLGDSIYRLEAQISDMNDAFFAASQGLQNKSISDSERTRLSQEQTRLQAEEVRLNEELKRLRAQADALVAAAR